MKDEIDSVMGLLDRLKEERKQELMSSQVSFRYFLLCYVWVLEFSQGAQAWIMCQFITVNTFL